ncbi:hypothetical protein RE6C_03176 [Rhodopirellula europaea 6C]|uniref:Uncharacterized protein n=1 Tax=Rhodopirellula europaea 6C TaxID=1263867 RepID=M2ATW1_9BACT|nr:hypothetical protein RE6C_03176 [Rhodopirellula europaea 6C]
MCKSAEKRHFKTARPPKLGEIGCERSAMHPGEGVSVTLAKQH